MPTKKARAQVRQQRKIGAKGQERLAQKAQLSAMRAKLAPRAQAADRGEEPKVMEELPTLSKRIQRTLKNRVSL
jgi:hypothetical protein